MLGISHYAVTLMDGSKGSLTNRHQCGVEHFKNDLKAELALAIPGAAAIYAGCKTPQVTNKIAKSVGDSIKFVVKKFPKVSDGISKINPTKLGKWGLLATGALYLVGVIANYANNLGRINQKYEDAAKIESQTKNVVLDDNKKCQQNYAEMVA